MASKDRDKDRKANQASNSASSKPSTPSRGTSNSVSTVNKTPVASNPNVASSYRAIERPTQSAQSLNPGSKGESRNTTPVNQAKPVNPDAPAEANKPTQAPTPSAPEPARRVRISSGNMKVTAKPVRAAKPTPEKTATKKPEPKKHQAQDRKKTIERHVQKTSEPSKKSLHQDARQMCKSRPTSNKPKGGAGSGKSFVPWKGTKFGC